MRDPEFDRPEKAAPPFLNAGRPFDRPRGGGPAALAAAAGFQLLVLAAIALANTLPWAGAGVQTVLLKVIPVDPRDLMRGDYVILGYEFSRVPPDQLPGPSSEREGRTIYVPLEPEADGRHSRGAGFVDEAPPAGPFLRGTLHAGGRITFGIESFYVQEGTGKAYEQAVRDGHLSAEVALTRDGRPSLRRLVIE